MKVNKSRLNIIELHYIDFTLIHCLVVLLWGVCVSHRGTGIQSCGVSVCCLSVGRVD